MILKTEGRALRGAPPRGLFAAVSLRAFGIAFALLACTAQAVVGYSVRSDGDKKLFRINLATGVASEVGATGFTDIEALAMNAAGDLYGVNPTTAQLIKCSTSTGACAPVGTLTDVPASPLANAGLTFEPDGKLYLAMNALIYAVDPVKAVTTVLGPSGAAISGLASGKKTATCASGIYAVGGNGDQGKFFCINTTNGGATQIGTVTGVSALDGGLDGDFTTGIVWGVTNGAAAQIYSVNPATLAVANVKAVTLNGAPVGGFESLAVQRSTITSAGPNFAAEVPTLGHFAALLLLGGLLSITGLRKLRK